MNYLTVVIAAPFFNGAIGDFAEQLGGNLAGAFLSALPITIIFYLGERYGRKKSSRTKQ